MSQRILDIQQPPRKVEVARDNSDKYRLMQTAINLLRIGTLKVIHQEGNIIIDDF